MSRFIQTSPSIPKGKPGPKVKPREMTKPGSYTGKELQNTKPIRTMSGKI